MTRHPRHRQVKIRELARRRVRTLTALAGIGSLVGAGALAVEVADASVPTTTGGAGATQPSKAPATPRVPHSLLGARQAQVRPHHRRHHHHHAVQPTTRPTTQATTQSTTQSTTQPATHPRRRVHRRPAATPTSTPPQQSSGGGSSSTSGGSHH